MGRTGTWAMRVALAWPLAAGAGVQPHNALDFDGADDFVSMANPPFVADLGQDFTVTFWLSHRGAGPSRVFFAQRDTANFATFLINSGNALFYVKRDNITVSSVTPAPPDGAWTHVAVRWNAAASVAEIFYDGVLQSTPIGGGSSTGIDGRMTLGARTDGAQPMSGVLDDVAIWGRARSVAELRAERVSTCVPRAGLQARYDFDLGLPGGDNTYLATLPDDAGSREGTLQNFALTGGTSNFIASPIARIAPGLVFDPPLGALATREDGSGYSGSVRLAVPPVQDVTVTFATDLPAEAIAAPAMLTFTPDDWNQPRAFTLTGVDDGVADGDVAFQFSAEAQSADACYDAVAVSQAGINAAAVAGTLAIAGVAQAEGDAPGTFEFLVTYAGTPAPAFTVPFSTQGGSAVAGVEFIAASGTLAFTGLPGETHAVPVTVLGNRQAQADRSFSVALGTPSLAGIATAPASAQGTLVDDDLDVAVSLDDGVSVVQPGQAVVYDLRVTNLSPALDAGVIDVGFVAVPLQALAWDCVASGGATCSGGSGAFAAQPTLPAGAQVRYTITGVVPATLGAPGEAGNLVAVASVAAAGDGQPGNDRDTDIDAGPRIFNDGYE